MDICSLAEQLYDCPSTDRALLHNIPLEIVGYGYGRIVTKDKNDPNNVIKFAVGKGIEQNKNEIKITSISRSKDFEDIIAPVLDYGPKKRWIKMPKVDCPEKQDDKITGPSSKEIHTKISKNGIYLYEIETGYLNNIPVAYDYGVVNQYFM